MADRNVSKELAGLMVTLSILTPAVLGLFYKIVNPENEAIVPLKYFFLAGFSVISLLIIIHRDLDHSPLRVSLSLNIVFTAILFMYLGYVNEISTYPPIVNVFFITVSNVIMFLNFILFPFLIMILTFLPRRL